ncbi:MAG TPA: ABC transporter permease [Ktedonobacteraceae bacterium]|jgi:ribose transport system permease protein|nr:ABC transporter permease [Ktedonobacteraceae bacterium]
MKSRLFLRMRSVARVDWLALLVLIIVGALGLSLWQSRFDSSYNMYVLLRSISVVIIVGFAQMVVLAVGELNLSVGALGGFVAVVLGMMLEVWHLPLPLAILLALATGLLAGLLNGLLIAWSGINGFIITLATSSAFTGMSLGLTQSIPFYQLPASFTQFGESAFGPLPYVLFVTLLVSLLLAGLLGKTVLGRQLLAVGGNRAAAELSGISLKRSLVWVHSISGLLVAVAAILGTAQLGSAQPSIGADWVLTSFAVPIIGGTALLGGSVSVIGTFLAAMVIALMNNGLILIQADPYWVQFLLGILILGSVGLGQVRVAWRDWWRKRGKEEKKSYV